MYFPCSMLLRMVLLSQPSSYGDLREGRLHRPVWRSASSVASASRLPLLSVTLSAGDACISADAFLCMHPSRHLIHSQSFNGRKKQRNGWDSPNLLFRHSLK